MLKGFMRLWLVCTLSVGIILGAAGCNGNSDKDQTVQQQAEKTREEVAKATERLKPALEDAGRQLSKAADRAGESARAAAEGAKEGWERGSHEPVDLNSASEKELTELSGITPNYARKIIDGRPYRDKRDLVIKGILPRSEYAKIQDQITVK